MVRQRVEKQEEGTEIKRKDVRILIDSYLDQISETEVWPD